MTCVLNISLVKQLRSYMKTDMAISRSAALSFTRSRMAPFTQLACVQVDGVRSRWIAYCHGSRQEREDQRKNNEN